MNVTDFRSFLVSGESTRCIAAATQATQVGEGAIAVAAELVLDQSLGKQTRTWALRALAQFLGSHPTDVAAAAVSALGDSEPEVRSLALQVLGKARVPSTIGAVAAILSDPARDPNDWSDHAQSVGDTAKATLRAIGTPEALAKLGGSGA